MEGRGRSTPLLFVWVWLASWRRRGRGGRAARRAHCLRLDLEVHSPKSASLTWPEAAISTFDGLMSRWITPWSCKYRIPESTSAT
eukprot:6899612-Prymnesium_polylepis.1